MPPEYVEHGPGGAQAGVVPASRLSPEAQARIAERRKELRANASQANGERGDIGDADDDDDDGDGGQQTPQAAAAAGEPKPEGLAAAVEMERSARALDAARNDLQSLRRELQQLKDAGRDPMALLQAHGHQMEHVVQSWLGDEKPGEGGQQQRSSGGQDPAIQQLQQQVQQLTQLLNGQHQQKTREGRKDGISRLISGSGDTMSALGLLNGAELVLQDIEAQERSSGVTVGQTELLQKLHAAERETRKNVEAQVASLAKLPWAQQAMRKALDGAAASAASAGNTGSQNGSQRDHQTPSTQHAGNDLMNADAGGSGQHRVYTGASLAEVKRRAREKVQQILEKRSAGLG